MTDYAKLDTELQQAQEALHTFIDTNQTAGNRKAAKRHFVEAALALEPDLDPVQLWEIAEILSDRENAQNNILGSSTTGFDAASEQLEADLSGKALAAGVTESLQGEYEKDIAANFDRVTEFLAEAYQSQQGIFVSCLNSEGVRVLGPLAKQVDNYSQFVEWLVLRTLLWGYNTIHFKPQIGTGHFPRFDRAKGYIVVNFPEETALAAYSAAIGRGKRAEAAGDLDLAKHHKAQAETFGAILQKGLDIVPGEPKLYPAPIWGEAVTLDKILAEMFPDVKLPDRAAVKEAVWLLGERMTAEEFKQWVLDYAPELVELVEPVVTAYSDIVRAAKVGAGYEPELTFNTYFDAGRPKRTDKIEALKQRILNTAAVIPNYQHIAAGFGKRKGDVIELLRENGIEQSKRGPKRGRKRIAA